MRSLKHTVGKAPVRRKLPSDTLPLEWFRGMLFWLSIPDSVRGGDYDVLTASICHSYFIESVELIP